MIKPASRFFVSIFVRIMPAVLAGLGAFYVEAFVAEESYIQAVFLASLTSTIVASVLTSENMRRLEAVK